MRPLALLPAVPEFPRLLQDTTEQEEVEDDDPPGLSLEPRASAEQRVDYPDAAEAHHPHDALPAPTGDEDDASEEDENADSEDGGSESEAILNPIPIGTLCDHIRHVKRFYLPVLFFSEGGQLASSVEISVKDSHALSWLAKFARRRCQQGKPPRHLQAWALCRDGDKGFHRRPDSTSPHSSGREAFSL